MKIAAIFIFLILISGCATTKDLKNLETKVAQQEQESLNRDWQIIQNFKKLVDAYNQHLELFHFPLPKPESINPDQRRSN